jgi:hypothetical protein
MCYVIHVYPPPNTHIYTINNNKVKGIVRQNINKVVERGDKLEDLGDKAGT